jgi:glycosyltransferase A (GT-A) superfamily protein (DUF2064 family)
MLAEYNPFLEDEYDVVYFYGGDLAKFRSRYKYNIRRYIPALTDNVQAGMLYIHARLSRDYDKIIIVGSDIPGITKGTIKQAFAALDDHDAVMVPVADGGYGLIGMNGFIDIYSDIEQWDSSQDDYAVANETQKILEQHHKIVKRLPEQFDIDHVADIKKLYAQITQNEQLRPEYFYLQRVFDWLKKNKGALK